MRWCLLVAVVVGGCVDGPRPGPADRSRPSLDAAALAAVAARPEVVALDGDIALICSEAAAGTDVDDAAGDCDAAVVDGHGTLTALGRGGLLAAGRVDKDRLALLTRDRTLVLRTGATEVILGHDIADPRVAADRRAIAFTQLPAGAGIEPSTTGRLVVLDLDRGTRRVVSDHPLDSAPFLRPGTDDVLFVSGRTGVASLYLARPGQPPRQLTNVGAREVGPGFVPVFGRDLVWTDDGRVAVYTATYDGVATLWALDVDRAAATPLGAGRWPHLTADAVIAIDTATAAPIARTFAVTARDDRLAAPSGGAR